MNLIQVRFIVLFVFCFVFIFNIPIMAQNKVVVIPLSHTDSGTSVTGGIKVYDNNNQFLGYLIGSDEYLKVFNPTLNLVLPFNKTNLTLQYYELPWRFLGTTCYDQGDYYLWGIKTTNFPEIDPHNFAGFLLKDRFRINSYFSYASPAIQMATESKKENNGTQGCVAETVNGFHFKVTTYTAESLPITFPIALPIRYEIVE